jgi:hypothetical protein
MKMFAHLEMWVHEYKALEEDHNDLACVQEPNAHDEMEDGQAIACDVEVHEELEATKAQLTFVEEQQAPGELEEGAAFPGQQLKLVEIACAHLEGSLQNLEKSEFCPSAISYFALQGVMGQFPAKVHPYHPCILTKRAPPFFGQH